MNCLEDIVATTLLFFPKKNENEDLHSSHHSVNTGKVIKCRKLRRIRHLGRSTFKILTGMPTGS